ncbi:MAG: biotin/lipoyl-containing protein, partial [Bradyrhizobium sp.]|uniref:ATP-binding protein n=1 Tax=Bradyrhizobium sp. TaxID=376 RepID=UPI003C7A4E93
GGKGMRIAHSKNEVAEGYTLAKAEAKSSFGDDRIFIEKFIESPRHIEIQVLGDKHGHVVHLFERECSIQRRNQKVIEEAPSPLLDESARRKMGEQAVALAKAVNYDSAGTVEFVAGQDKSFFFLEMNTRLQVEHPVTELVTGIDLVEQMIRVAAGEKLSIAQKDVSLTGWAVESRVYAEDPFRNFLPSIGRLVKYRPPAESKSEGITVRNDTGVQEGGEISIYYDPMIAKLVTHAPSRAAAIEAQSSALDAFYVDGIRHNIPFLSALMNHPRWREGKLSTGFIAEEFPKGFAPRAPEGEVARRLAAVGAAIDHVLGERKRQISGQMIGRPVKRQGRRAVWLGRDEIVLDITRADGAIAVRFVGADGKVGTAHHLISHWKPGEPVWQGTIDGASIAVQVRPVSNGVRLTHQGVETAVYVYTEAEAASARLMPVVTATDTGKKLLCPMPGLVVSIAVSEGQEIKAGETLAVIEAMKMQNVLRAEQDGTVKKIHAAAGATLAVDALILEFA